MPKRNPIWMYNIWYTLLPNRPPWYTQSNAHWSKLFLCDVCSKSISKCSSLKRYLVIFTSMHSGYGPFECTVSLCVKRFSQADHLDAGWGAELKSVFNKLDMDDVFVNRSLCDLDNVNQRILELATVKWKDDVVSKPKLRTCINFKNALNPENYAMSIINRQKRALTAQLRMGMLPIKIETGWFRNMPLEERICELCRMNEIEDEEHFCVNVQYMMI